MLCHLLHAESGVLERNVSIDAVLQHKRATQQLAVEISRNLTTVIPELAASGTEDVIITLLLVAAAAWPYAQPNEVLVAAFEQDDTVAAMHRDFTAVVRRTLELTIMGLLA